MLRLSTRVSLFLGLLLHELRNHLSLDCEDFRPRQVLHLAARDAKTSDFCRCGIRSSGE